MTLEEFEKEPGYDFRLSEGMKALERSSAAGGRTLGGRAAKELTRFNQGFASHEYGRAEGRFQRNQENRYNRLMGLSGQGQGAANVMSGDVMSSARYGADAEAGIGRYKADTFREGGLFAGNLYAQAGAFRAEGTRDTGIFAGNAYEQMARDNELARIESGHYGGNLTYGSGMYGAETTRDSGKYGADVIYKTGGGVAEDTLGAGNATAAGQVGSANAYSDAVGGITNTVTDLWMMNKYGNLGSRYKELPQLKYPPSEPYGGYGGKYGYQ